MKKNTASAPNHQEGHGNMAMVQSQWSHFGVFGAPPSLVYFSGGWDVHWGSWVLTHGHNYVVVVCCFPGDKTAMEVLGPIADGWVLAVRWWSDFQTASRPYELKALGVTHRLNMAAEAGFGAGNWMRHLGMELLRGPEKGGEGKAQGKS